MSTIHRLYIMERDGLFPWTWWHILRPSRAMSLNDNLGLQEAAEQDAEPDDTTKVDEHC